MIETSYVTLDLPLTISPDHVLVRAEWWEPQSRFAVVKYAIRGDIQDYGLRLDLDKRAFLDQFENEELDACLEGMAVRLSDVIAAAKEKTRGTTTKAGFEQRLMAG